ncbi:aminotransferase class III-fold pyridoxal phosphate-dependent enzyme [Nocardia sp. NPDC059691]|uniref:aminotransferase class III-fold pyridoxal phosphate-dependent enzyme n=1 Tax=Nocardia sp. NPDC059691 TaxID=3346908 RepID=UPI0036A814A4
MDVTTTAVGRDTLFRTYESFFTNVQFSGNFRVVVTIDHAYGISAAERKRSIDYLTELPQRFPRIREVVVEQFSRPVGLAKALSVLISHATAPIGIHLEDDWEILDRIDVDGLIEQLDRHDSTAIVFGNEHVARGGTFERPDEQADLGELVRLVGASWARYHLPLCPHLHRTRRWAPTVAKALAETDELRCPDDRIREHIIERGGWARHNILWTKKILARDIGRDWLSARAGHKSIVPEHDHHQLAKLPLTLPEELPRARSAALARQSASIMPEVSTRLRAAADDDGEFSYPILLERGDGALVWDVDGSSYLDFVCGRGSVTLGHNHPAVTNVIRDRVARGTALSLPTPSDLGVAELVLRSMGSTGAVRFFDARAGALRSALELAQWSTGRSHAVIAGPRWSATTSDAYRYVPLDSAGSELRLIEAIRADPPAALLLTASLRHPISSELAEHVQAACADVDALFVLDETFTGFRVAPGGLRGSLGIRPDLCVFSYGLASGLTPAALAGSLELMRRLEDLPLMRTEPGVSLLTLEIAKATLREYARADYYQRLTTLGNALIEGINTAAVTAGLPALLSGYSAAPRLTLPGPWAERFLTATARRGLLLRRGINFLTAAHSETQIDFAVDVVAETISAFAPELRASAW